MIAPCQPERDICLSLQQIAEVNGRSVGSSDSKNLLAEPIPTSGSHQDQL